MINLKKISIAISEQQDVSAKYFSEHYDYSKYLDRGQSDINNMKRQNYEGKKVEFAVYNWFKSNGWDITEVDVNIYPPNEKSFAQDLKSRERHFQIKSQSKASAEMWGTSFIFQYGNIFGKDKTGDKDGHAFDNIHSKDGVIFALIDNRDITIIARTNIETLHKHSLFKEPKKRDLLGVKKAVYLEDLEKIVNGHI